MRADRFEFDVDTNLAANSGTASDSLVKALGTDLGVRTAIVPNVQLSLSLWRLDVDSELYNVFDSEDSDITYFYPSRLANEAEPVDDIHFHPVEPRTLRATLSASF